jgi:hypothetical protein
VRSLRKLESAESKIPYSPILGRAQYDCGVAVSATRIYGSLLDRFAWITPLSFNKLDHTLSCYTLPLIEASPSAKTMRLEAVALVFFAAVLVAASPLPREADSVSLYDRWFWLT